jgi:hypothetical protein
MGSIRTIVLLPVVAKRATSTNIHQRLHATAITDLEAFDVGADFHYNTRALVPGGADTEKGHGYGSQIIHEKVNV